MTSIEFLNSNLGIFILGTAVTGGGWLLRTSFTATRKLEARMQNLEYTAIEQINIKTSIANFGSRIGDLESEHKVIESNFAQITIALEEQRQDRKDNNAVSAEIFSALNGLKTSMAVMEARLESIDKRFTRLEEK